MLIGGLQKTTLIDFPGRVACTVFTVGCNFRCPFCHNKDLVSLANFKKAGIDSISEDYFFDFLEKRKKILDGVCITGGEPTVHADLPQFCKKIKDLSATGRSSSGRGLEVKLDTNGSNPEMLKKLIDKGLVDFIAMDVKSSFGEYQNSIKLKIKNKISKIQTKNTKINKNLIRNIKKSIKLILQSGLEYELRTTVVPGIHNKTVMVELAKDLKSLAVSHSRQKAGKQPSAISINYILQQFRPQNCLDSALLKVEPFTKGQMQAILKAVQQILPKTKLRSAD